jgi:hypothetical protein
MKKNLCGVLLFLLVLLGCTNSPSDPYSSYTKIFITQRLKVYLDTDANYIIDYYDAAGNPLYAPGTPVTPNGTLQVLYTAGLYDKLAILSDNTIQLTEGISGGLHQFSININGLAIEMDNSSGTPSFLLHFMNRTSGQYNYNAAITDITTNAAKIHFTDLAAPDIDLQRSMDAFETWEEFMNLSPFTDDAAANATIDFKAANNLDLSNGSILSIAFTRD